jgi:hypothetical protein
MKLLLESWNNYLSEELLVESLEQAEASVLNRATKLVKGWSYSHNKRAYDFIEEKMKDSLENEWGLENPNIDEIEGYAFGWKIGGYFILSLIKNKLVPKDIEEKQKKIALMWNYKQLAEGKIVYLNDLLHNIFKYISVSYVKGKTSIKITFLMDEDSSLSALTNYISTLYHELFNYQIGDIEDRRTTRRSKLIENFFQWNRFVRDGKKDLNSVSDYNELYQLVEEAKILYQAWQEKQEQKDVEAGKEVLLDDKNWQIIAIHNKGAACQLGKGTEWCTAAPGLDYFKQYYSADDPLFFILDKTSGERYQFHFGTQQFMDESDSSLSQKGSSGKTWKDIMYILMEVVPAKYTKAWDYWEENHEIFAPYEDPSEDF